MKKISVIIPTYNRAQTLGPTIESLIQQDLAPEDYEIIVVDNNSSDGTAKLVEELARTSAVSIRYFLETRQGVHYARNSAIGLAGADILYYTDDDVIIDRHALAAILEPFADAAVGSVGGKVLPKWEAEPPKWVVRYFGGGHLSLLDYGDKPLVLNGPDIWSCHMAVRKDLLIECGGFNPENTAGIWIGDGETGLLQKILKMGAKVIYTPRAIVLHVIPAHRVTQEYMNLRLRNQGACDSYADYREKRFPRGRLLFLSLKWLIRSAKQRLLAFVGRILRKDRWRVYRTQASYWHSRHSYDLKLATSADFRAMVLKEDWLK